MLIRVLMNFQKELYYGVFPKPCWPQTLVRNIVLQIPVWEISYITIPLPYFKTCGSGYHLPNYAQILNLDFGDLHTVIPAYIPSIVPWHVPISNSAHSCRSSHVNSGFFDFACGSFLKHSDISYVTSTSSPGSYTLPLYFVCNALRSRVMLHDSHSSPSPAWLWATWGKGLYFSHDRSRPQA